MNDYDALKSVWNLAWHDTPVMYSGSLPREYRAAYRSTTHEILLNRPEYHGQYRPANGDPAKMREETTVLAHEIGHAQNHIWDSGRFAEYLKALKALVDVGLDGTLISECQRQQILREESMARDRGAVVIQTLAPHLLGDFYLQEEGNLTSYRSILWTGTWLNGNRGVHWPQQQVNWPPR